MDNASAAPGGCKQRKGSMTATETATASAPAQAPSGTSTALATPTHIDNKLPANTGQGCDNGLDGMPNTSTALAPNDASSQGPCKPVSAPHPCPSQATSNMPQAMPMAMRSPSRTVMPTGAGQNRCSHNHTLWAKDKERGGNKGSGKGMEMKQNGANATARGAIMGAPIVHPGPQSVQAQRLVPLAGTRPPIECPTPATTLTATRV